MSQTKRRQRRTKRAPGLGPFRAYHSHGRVYVRCMRCRGWGKEHWAHLCGRGGSPHGNWHPTLSDLIRRTGP